MIAIIGRRLVANPFLAESMLKLVAVRAAGELERKQAEDAIRKAGDRLKEIVKLAPAFMGILRGREHVFEVCNDRYLEMVGKRDMLNLPIRRALPELEGQGFFELLDGAFETGLPYSGSEVPVRLQRTPGEALEEVIVNFVYMPLREADGSVSGIFVHGVDVSEQVLARRRIEQLAEEARQTALELERSNKDLDQFASVASHDLQEPLRVVTGFVQLLKNKYKDKLDAEADQFIEFAVDGARRMETLIKDLLAYVRVGRRGNVLVPTDAGLALRQALGNLGPRIQETAAEVAFGELPIVCVDGPQLVQLFQNLLSNALKFHGPEPPRIRVDACRNEGHWEFTIRDNGIGIAPESQDRIFQIFERLHSRTQYPGTGIGLAICKKIVERHGGTIWAESQPGQGAAFHFIIPI